RIGLLHPVRREEELPTYRVDREIGQEIALLVPVLELLVEVVRCHLVPSHKRCVVDGRIDRGIARLVRRAHPNNLVRPPSPRRPVIKVLLVLPEGAHMPHHRRCRVWLKRPSDFPIPAVRLCRQGGGKPSEGGKVIKPSLKSCPIYAGEVLKEWG